jgi:hypothetical protein
LSIATELKPQAPDGNAENFCGTGAVTTALSDDSQDMLALYVSEALCVTDRCHDLDSRKWF